MILQEQLKIPQPIGWWFCLKLLHHTPIFLSNETALTDKVKWDYVGPANLLVGFNVVSVLGGICCFYVLYPVRTAQFWSTMEYHFQAVVYLKRCQSASDSNFKRSKRSAGEKWSEKLLLHQGTFGGDQVVAPTPGWGWNRGVEVSWSWEGTRSEVPWSVVFVLLGKNAGELVSLYSYMSYMIKHF